MYIISVDLGSSNFKAIIMKIDNDDISFQGKIKHKITDFPSFFDDIIRNYDIDKKDIEVIVATGTGASYLLDSYEGINVIKISEFDAIGYGGLILAKKEKGIVVSIGTGTALVYSDFDKNKHIGGTGIGGGTLVGLGKRLINKNELNISDGTSLFMKLIEYAKKGDRRNVDLWISDINKENIDNLTTDITASNFAAIDKIANDYDIASGIVNMILETISLLVSIHKKNVEKDIKEDLPVIFIGTMVTDDFVKERLIEISEFTKDTWTFIDDADFAIAIGSYEYYLLRMRKNF